MRLIVEVMVRSVEERSFGSQIFGAHISVDALSKGYQHWTVWGLTRKCAAHHVQSRTTFIARRRLQRQVVQFEPLLELTAFVTVWFSK